MARHNLRATHQFKKDKIVSHQAKLFALQNLYSQIESERVKLLGSMPKPQTHGHNEVERKIETWKQTIKNVERDLKSQSHFNHMVHQQNRFGPGSYSAGQRLASQESNVAELSDALGKVAVALVDLITTLYGGPAGEARALEGLKHALNNWMKAAKNTEQGMMGAAPQELTATVRQLESQMPRGGTPTGPGVIDIFTLILSFFVLIKSLNKK